MGELEARENESEQVAQDLVQTLVLPEVERLADLRQAQVESRRFEDAASYAAQVVVQGISSRTNSQQGPRST
jgi:hypothetical protein